MVASPGICIIFPYEGPGDVVEVGLWFYPEDEQPELETVGEAMFRVDGLDGMARGQDIVIPPHGYSIAGDSYNRPL